MNAAAKEYLAAIGRRGGKAGKGSAAKAALQAAGIDPDKNPAIAAQRQMKTTEIIDPQSGVSTFTPNEWAVMSGLRHAFPSAGNFKPLCEGSSTGRNPDKTRNT